MSRMKIKPSQKRIKSRLKRSDALQALRGLDSVKQLPELLKQAMEVNQALVEENARLNAEVSNILEEHDQRLKSLENVLVKNFGMLNKEATP